MVLRREGIVDGPTYDEIIAAKLLTEVVLEALHSAQYIYPLLAPPITLPAEGNAWTWGALTTIAAINVIGADYSVHELSISGMSANANFAIRLSYGAGDTFWAYASIARGGVQAQSVVIPVSGGIIPANSIFTAQLADSIGTSTLALKIAYHLHP